MKKSQTNYWSVLKDEQFVFEFNEITVFDKICIATGSDKNQNRNKKKLSQ